MLALENLNWQHCQWLWWKRQEKRIPRIPHCVSVIRNCASVCTSTKCLCCVCVSKIPSSRRAIAGRTQHTHTAITQRTVRLHPAHTLIHPPQDHTAHTYHSSSATFCGHRTKPTDPYPLCSHDAQIRWISARHSQTRRVRVPPFWFAWWLRSLFRVFSGKLAAIPGRGMLRIGRQQHRSTVAKFEKFV